MSSGPVPLSGIRLVRWELLGCAGKYTETNLPKGPRGAVINADRVKEVQPLLTLMRDIGSAHGNKTPGQVRYVFCVRAERRLHELRQGG